MNNRNVPPNPRNGQNSQSRKKYKPTSGSTQSGVYNYKSSQSNPNSSSQLNTANSTSNGYTSFARGFKANQPQDEPEQLSRSVLAVKLLMLAASVGVAFIFGSFLPVSVTYNYTLPRFADTELSAEAAAMSNRLDESYVPVETEPETDDKTETSEPDPELPTYDFAQPVSVSPEYPLDYFNDKVFIGDSRTVGLITYTDIDPIDMSSVGLNIGQLENKAYLRYTDENGQKQTRTCFEALEDEKGNYTGIYLALGLNELGWSPKPFIDTYRKVIEDIREVTGVPIYIQLILPITTEYSENSTFGITNEKASQFNELLRSLADEMDVFLLDPTELFALEDGTLDPANSSDGVHLNVAAYKVLLDFYRTHVVDLSEYENLCMIEVVENSNETTNPAPEETTSVDTTPVDTTPVDTAPVDTAPIDTAPVDTAPVDTTPVDTAPVDTAPVDTTPVDTAPADTTPVYTTPLDTPPLDTPPVDTAPADTPSAEITSVDTAPVETTSADTTPAETTPVDTAPVDTAPVDTTSADTAPVDTTSIDAPPVDITPVDTAPVDGTTADTSADALL